MNKISTKSFVMFNGKNAKGTGVTRSSRRISQKTFTFFGAMLLTAVFLLSGGNAWGQTVFIDRSSTSVTYGTLSGSNGSFTYTPPKGYRITKIECWGGGGSGSYDRDNGGRGGGGGGYATNTNAITTLPVNAAVQIYVGKGGSSSNGASSYNGQNGDSTTVSYNNVVYVGAYGGKGGNKTGTSSVKGQGGQGGWSGITGFSITGKKGGNGGDRYHWGTLTYSGGGGSGAGSSAGGNNGDGASTLGNGDGGSGVQSNPGEVIQSTAKIRYGGTGGYGNSSNSDFSGGLTMTDGCNGMNYGGGGGGAHETWKSWGTRYYRSSGAGAQGCVRITIEKVEMTITANSNNKVYDGLSLNDAEFTVKYKEADYPSSNGTATLVNGFVVKAVITTTITDADTVDNEITSYQVFQNDVELTGDQLQYVEAKNGKLAISKRPITFTSASKTWTYDGQSHDSTKVNVTSGSWVTGEGVEFSNFSSITRTGSVDNEFTISWKSNTKESNYTVTKVYGTLTINQYTDPVVVTITEHSDTKEYNGQEQEVKGYDFSPSVSFYTASDYTFSGTASASGTECGNYHMQLVPEDFTNVNTTDFANVTFAIVDGSLTITPRTGVVVTVTEHGDELNYDGQSHTVSGYDISCNDQLYNTSTYMSFSGTSSVSGTEVGTYSMNLQPNNFTNTNTNFSGVVFNIVHNNLNIYPTFTASVVPTDITCHDASNGSATITVAGGKNGNPRYYYSLDNGVSTGVTSNFTLNNLSKGNHKVVVTDLLGNEIELPFIINEPEVMSLTSAITPATCPGTATGKVVLTVVGGNDGNYQAIGNLGSPSISGRTITFSNVAAGNYFVAVNDSKGCSSTSNITVGEPETLGFETCTQNKAFPCPEGESYVTLTPGTDFSLPVVKEGVNTTGLVTEVKGLPDGGKYYAGQTYSISYIISNSCGEKDTCSFEIIINDQNAPDITCPNNVTTDCISKVATEAPLSTTYNEFILNGGTVTGNHVDLASYRYVETSTGDDCHKVITRNYYISNYTPVEGQCVQTITVDDDVLPVFTASTVKDLHLACDASNRNTTINNWLNSIEATDNCGTPTITNNFLTLELPTSGCGEVTVTFTATDNCNNSDDVTAKIVLEDNEAPHLISGKVFPVGQTNMNVCRAGIPAATSDNEIKALYTDNSGNVNVSHTETVTGTDCSWTATYVYTISDLCNHSFQQTISYSGGDNSAPVVVGSIPTQNPTVSNCTFTVPDVTELVRVIVSDNCTDKADLIITQSPEANSSIALGAAAREDDITVTVKDLCGKQTTTTVKVAVPAALSVTATASQNTICKYSTNTSVQLSANVNGGTAPYQYTWGPVTGSTASITDSPSSQTEYSVTVKDANNCEKEANVTVTVVEPKIALASFANQTICAPGTGISEVTLTAVPTEQKGTVTYAWSPEAGLSATSGQTVTASPTVTTYYTVVATADLDGCQTTDTKTVKVTVKTPVVVLNSVNNVTSCAGNEVVMSANTALYSGELSWKWTLNNDSVANTRNYEFTPSVTEPITEYQFAVTATVKDGNCSTSDSKQVTLTVNNPIITLADILDTTICIGGTAPLKAIATANYSGVQYVWSPAYGLDYADRAEVTASPNVGQTYTVTAILKIGNCQKSDNKSVSVTVNTPYVTLNDITSNQPDTICAGPDVTLSVSYNEEYTSAELIGENPHVTYAWSSSNSEEMITSTDATITVHPLATTTYTVTATAHEGECSSIDVKSFTVYVQSPVSIAFVNDADAARTVCEGAALEAVKIDYDHADLKMEWINDEVPGIYLVGDQIMGNAQADGLTAEQTYPYRVVATSDEDNPKCPTDTIFGAVAVRPLPKVNLTSGELNQTVCSGEAITPIVVNGVNATLTISDIDLTVAFDQDNTVATISGTKTLTTETAPVQLAYTVTATSEFTDPSCGTTTLDGTITVNPLSSLTVGENRKQSICFDQPIADIEVLHDVNSTVRVTGLPNGVTYKEAEHKISGTPYSEGQYVYTVMATSNFAHACDTLIVTDTITVKPLVTLAAATNANPTTCADVAISPIRLNYSNATLTIQWKNDQDVIIDQPDDLDTNMTVTSSMIHGILTTSGTYTISGTPATAGTYTYTMTATSTMGCEPKTLVGTVTVSPIPQLTVTSGNATQTVCAGQAIQTIEISHPNSTLNTPNVAAYGLEFVQVTADSATISGTPTATDNFNLSASNNCGTADLIPVSVTVNALPTITITNAEQTVCKDEAIVPMTITVTNATVDSAAIAAVLPAGLSYSHSTGRITGAPTMAKDSTFTVTATSNLVPACGTTSAVITLHVNPLVTLSVTNAEQTFCLGESIQPIKVTFNNASLTVPDFAAESGLSYNSADSTITGTPAYGGTYTYTLTAQSLYEHACTPSSQTITVTVHDTLPLTISGNRAVCVSGSLNNNVLSLSTNNMLDCSYVWSVDGGTVESGDDTPSINVSWSSTGTKIVTVTVTNNTNNCVSHQTKSITVNGLPAVSITEAPAAAVCPNVGYVVCEAVASEGAGRYTFEWTSELPLDVTSSGANSQARVRIPSLFCDTVYYVGVTVTDGNACAVSAAGTTVFVKDVTGPNISAVETLTALPDADHDCSFMIPDFSNSVTAEDNCGGTLTVTQLPVAGTSYQQTEQVQSIPVTVTVADACGNSASTTVNVTIPRKISVSLNTPEPICEGGETALISTVEYAQGEVSYVWIPTTGLSIDPSGDKAKARPMSTQTYYLNVIDENHCTASDVVTVTVISAPEEFSFNCIGTLEYQQKDTLHLSRGLVGHETLTWSSSDEEKVPISYLNVDTAVIVDGSNLGTSQIKAIIENLDNPEGCQLTEYVCEVNVVEKPIYLTCPTDMEEVYDGLSHKADSSLITTRARVDGIIVPIEDVEISFQTSTDNLQWTDPMATMPSIQNVFDGPLFVRVTAHHENYTDANCSYKMTLLPKPVMVALKHCKEYDGTPLETPLSSGIVSDPSVKFTSGSVTSTSYVGGKYNMSSGTSQLSSEEVMIYNDDVRNYDITIDAEQYIVRPIISGVPMNQCPLPEGESYTLEAQTENLANVSYSWRVYRDGVEMTGLTLGNEELNIPSDGTCHTYTVSLKAIVSECAALTEKTFKAEDDEKPNIIAISREVNAVPDGQCQYRIPNLTDTAFVWYSDNCTEASKLVLEQDAEGVITQTQNVRVTVSDLCGNTNSVRIRVVIPESLSLSRFSSTDVLCQGEQTGTVTVVAATGGTPGYTYSINDPNAALVDRTFSGLGAGTYVVTVTDSNHCSAQLNVTVSEPEDITAGTAETTPSTCANNDGRIVVSGTRGGIQSAGFGYFYNLQCEALNYNQNRIGTLSNGEASVDFDHLAQGVYTLTVKDANGCEKQLGDITVGRTADLTVTMPDTLQICSGGDVRILPTVAPGANGYMPDVTYSWSCGDRGATDVRTIADMDVVNSGSTPVVLTYYVTSSNINCSLEDSVKVVVNPMVVISTQSYEFCSNEAGYVEIIPTFSQRYSTLSNTVKCVFNDDTTYSGINAQSQAIFTVHVPNADCKRDYIYTILYLDNAGCEVSAKDTIHVGIFEDFVFSGDYISEATVECKGEAVAPHTIDGFVMPTVVDGCGRQITEAPVLGADPEPVDCEGDMAYTYTYTDCAGRTTDWTFTYHIVRTTPPSEFVAEGGQPKPTTAMVEYLAQAVAPASNRLPDVRDVCGNSAELVRCDTVTTNYPCENTRTYTYTYKDCVDSIFTWTFTYTIIDTTAPAINTTALTLAQRLTSENCEFRVTDLKETVRAQSYDNVVAQNHLIITQTPSADSLLLQQDEEYEVPVFVTVKDSCDNDSTVVFTLTVPAKLKMFVDNITPNTCYGKNAGSIQIHASGGTPQYIYTVRGIAYRNYGMNDELLLSGLNVPSPNVDSVAFEDGHYNHYLRGYDSITVLDADGCQPFVNVPMWSPAQSGWLTPSGDIQNTFITDTLFLSPELGKNYVTIVPGDTFEIPQFSNYNVNPIINRSYVKRGTNDKTPFSDDNAFLLNTDTTDYEPVIYLITYQVQTTDCEKRRNYNYNIPVKLAPNLPPIISCPAVDHNYACVGDVPAAYASYDAFVAAGGMATDDQQNELGEYAIDPSSFALKSQNVDNSNCHHTTVTRTYTIKDIAGNESEPCTQVFVVNDSIAPLLTNVPAELDAVLDVNGGNCQYSYPDFDAYLKNHSLVSDNCTDIQNLTIAQNQSGNITLNVAQQSVPVTITVTDGCGNTSEATVNVIVPAQLTASATMLTQETCAGNDGTATITAVGGTPQVIGGGNYYHFSCQTDWATTATLTGMSHSGSYTVTVTDDKGCQATVNPSVTLYNPFETITLDPVSVPAVCNGKSFDAVHPSLPDGTHYSWTAPTGNINLSGMTGGTDETSIHGTLTNSTNIPQSITYTVTPTIGTLCAGDAFNVTIGVDVTVNPTVLASLENKTTCKNQDVELSLSLSNVYSEYNVVWYLGATQMARQENVAAPTGGAETLVTMMSNSLMMNCKDSLHYRIEYSDQSGCTISQGADIFVRTPEWHVTAEDGAATVTDISAAVPPHTVYGLMPTVTDGCGMVCSHNTNPIVTSTGSNCDGTKTFTYTYTACDGSTDTWSYVYTIQGDMVVRIDSVDAGCYTANNDGSIFYTVSGAIVYRAYLDDNYINRGFEDEQNSVSNLTDGSHILKIEDMISGCTVSREVVITPDPTVLTVTGGDGEWTYDAAAHEALTYKVQLGETMVSENVASGSSVTLPNGDVLTATVTGTITNVGTENNTVNSITVMRGTTDVTCHYNTTLAKGTLTVNPAAVTVTANPATKVYGAADPTFSGTVTGLLNGQPESLITYTLSRQTGENVGDYAITPAGDSVQGNYAVNYVAGTMSITPATVTVKADAKTKVYGNLDPTFTAMVIGLQNDDVPNEISYTLARAEGENVGKYAITPSGESLQGNYNVLYAKDTLTITPLTVGVSITGNTSMVAYNGTDQQVTGFTAVSNNSSYDVANVSDNNSAVASGTDVGVHYMHLSADNFVNNDANFDVQFSIASDGWMEIVPEGTVIVTITGHHYVADYNTEEHNVSGYDVSIWTPEGSDEYTTADFTFNGNATAHRTYPGTTNMGLEESQFVNTNGAFGNVRFNVTDGYLTINKTNVEVLVAGNTDITEYSQEEVTVTGYTLSITNPSSGYDTANVNFSGNAMVSGTTAGMYYMGLDNSQFSNNDTNYNVTFNVSDGWLQIVKAGVVIVKIIGNNNVADYDGNIHTVTGYVVDTVQGHHPNGRAYADYYPLSAIQGPVATASQTDAGTAYMGLTNADFTNTNDDFLVVFHVTDGYQTVNPIDVTVTITERSAEVDYDGQLHTVTGYDVTSIQIGGENTTLYTVDDFTFSGDATVSGTDAGNYDMALSASDFTNTNSNFANVTFNIVDGQLVVNPIDVTVTITEHSGEFNYDGEEHEVSGYDVTSIQIGGQNTDLYTVADFTFSGNDTVRGTNADTYAMTLSASDFANTNSNFATVTFNIVDGQMVIKPINVTVTITEHSGEFNYNGEEHKVVGYDVTSIQIGGQNTNLYTVADFTFSGNDTVRGMNAGTYAMTLSASDFTNTNSNFETVTFNIVDGQMVIKPIDVTVTITEHSGEVNYNGSEQMVTGYDVAFSNTLYTTADFTFSGNDTARGTNVGTYAMALRASDFTNTSGNFENVTFNIVDGQLVIKPIDVTVKIVGNNSTKVYDGQPHTVTGYEVTAIEIGGQSTTLYTVADFTFSGVATATQTDVGRMNMGLTASQFENTNDNFANVTFDVTDGYQIVIVPGPVTVTITGKKDTVDYNRNLQTITGYTVSISDSLYTEDDFTFNGNATASGTNAGKYSMGLSESDFINTNVNFDDVTFVVNDGELVINKVEVSVSIVGTIDTVEYDGEPHTVTGYTMTSTPALYTEDDYTFTGNATASQTVVGTTYMGLAINQFTNTNGNFSQVSFNVEDGYQMVLPKPVVVTITGANNTTDYDGELHTVTGYDVTSIQIDGQSTTLYTTANFTFSGEATASQRNAGTDSMGLVSSQFTNINNNFTVTFNVIDGFQTVKPINVTVTITEHSGEFNYNGEEHKVTGYDVTSIQIGGQSTTLYTVADFTFSGNDTVRGKNAGRYDMSLSASDFTNTNSNFETVTFNIVNGQLVIKPIDVTVTITEHSGEVNFNGTEQMVTGYDVVISNPLYTEADFTFNGNDTARGMNAGTYAMMLSADDFTNTSSNFATVTFNIVDGQLVIKPIEVTVTITEHSAEVDYNGAEQMVTGYDVEVSNTLYTTADFTFSGNDTARGTNMGTYAMALDATDFENTSSNFVNVTFNIVDGQLMIKPIDVTVTITEHSAEVDYNGAEQMVTGYDVAVSNSLYTTADFTFRGNDTARGTDAGAYTMELSADDFENTSSNFATVTFNIENGQLVIKPISVTVTITEHSGEADYDGEEHEVVGYDVTSIQIGGQNTDLYTAADFTFNGTDTVRGKNAGTYDMDLNPVDFSNTNDNFAGVIFNVVNGQLVINPIDVTVTITEHSGVANYDGQPHKVTGYDVTSIQIGGQSTTLYTAEDFKFNGDSTVTGTEVGVYEMGLTAADFTNLNSNFETVTFNIVNGQLEIKPIGVTVTITEHGGEFNYDGVEHEVTGYDVTSIKIGDNNTDLYTAADFTFSGTDTVRGTDAGTYYMELQPADFTNINDNFESVTFVIVDSHMVIKPIDVTVTITEHSGEFNYDGEEHKVAGYDVAFSNTLYTTADFTFSGNDTVRGTNADTYAMELSADDFENTSSNFATVTFNIENGQLVINPIDVTVTITEHGGEVNYNGSEQMVTGYDVAVSNSLYTTADFTFGGNDTARGTNAGTYAMALSSDDFENTSTNFANVTFNIVDSQLVINKITAEVTIIGSNNTTDYDRQQHTVTGYTANANTQLYDVDHYITFNGTATASQTVVGTTYMGLAESQFSNNNDNFSQVKFYVTDGFQTINYAAVTVTVKGHHDTAYYDAMDHEVSGYEFEFSNNAYLEDFITYTGTAYATRREAGTTYMGIDRTLFSNTNDNFSPVVFNVVDGYQAVVIPDSMVIVRIKGHVDTLVYNGAEQEVTGYEVVEIIPDVYSEDDFTFEAPGRAARTTVGTTMMGLSPAQFVNHNPRYNHVAFEILEDGSLTVTKRPLTLTGETNTLVYNGAQQSLTDVTADNIVTGHTWTINYKATGKAAGEYNGEFSGQNRIMSGNTDVTDNYDISLETGSLTIMKKALTVSNPATPLTKTYDGTPFSVDYTILQFTGLEGDDAITSGTITTDSYRAGTYLCNVGNRWATTATNEAVASGFGPTEVTSNYAVQFNVTLVISPRQLTVTVLDSAKIFDGEPLTQDRYIVTNLAETDQAVVTTSGSQTNPGTGVSVVDRLEITHNGEDAIDNYRITRVNGRLLVVSESSDFTCPDPVTVILKEGTSDTIVPLRVLGPITHLSVETGEATITNNLDELNPMSVGVHMVTWNLVSNSDGELIASCEQAVVVEYTPCEAVIYHNYNYPARRIGSQCWLTENLRNTMDASGNDIANYHAYRDDMSNFDKFGYLYSWYSTVGISEDNVTATPITQIGDNGQPYVQGICPNGWAVCSLEDYSELNATVGDALLLKDAGEEYWQAGSNGVTPNSGFNSRGGGWFNSTSGRYEDRYTGFHLWFVDAAPGSPVATGTTITTFCDSSVEEMGRKSDLRSVRCIRKVYVNE